MTEWCYVQQVGHAWILCNEEEATHRCTASEWSNLTRAFDSYKLSESLLVEWTKPDPLKDLLSPEEYAAVLALRRQDVNPPLPYTKEDSPQDPQPEAEPVGLCPANDLGRHYVEYYDYREDGTVWGICPCGLELGMVKCPHRKTHMDMDTRNIVCSHCGEIYLRNTGITPGTASRIGPVQTRHDP